MRKCFQQVRGYTFGREVGKGKAGQHDRVGAFLGIQAQAGHLPNEVVGPPLTGDCQVTRGKADGCRQPNGGHCTIFGHAMSIVQPCEKAMAPASVV
jgi:hypothetical protein